MKGWESTSEMMEALKLLALSIFFFFSPIISKLLKLPLPLEPFICPDEPPPLLPVFASAKFFFYLLNKLLRDALMYRLASTAGINSSLDGAARSKARQGG